jgi:type IV pilus assembly protein PilM
MQLSLPSRSDISLISKPKIKLNMNIGRRLNPDVVGLDIQPGFVAAVKARVNGSIVAEQAASMALGPEVVRDGEVMDEEALSEALREMFSESKLGKRVRLGVANQRTVLRTLELPPVTDQKELAAAVTFQAQDQVPMPLNNAVLDFHPLGIIETPAGPRQRVVLVAAQRDMVERLIGAVRRAGLTPEGVDLSAFALIRSLYRADPQQSGRVLYLNVDGLTNLAIAEGTICHFTRVVGGGLEGMATELAERRGIALIDARAQLLGGELTATEIAPAGEASAPAQIVLPEPGSLDASDLANGIVRPPADAPAEAPAEQQDGSAFSPDGAQLEPHPEPQPVAARPTSAPAPAPSKDGRDAEVLSSLEAGVREISGEVRNSLDFHRSQEGGGEVSHVVLSGAAQDITGFAEALQAALGVEVRSQTISLHDDSVTRNVSAHRLAVAAGLASSEVAQ